MSDYLKSYNKRTIMGMLTEIPRTPSAIMGYFDAVEDERRRAEASENNDVTQAAAAYFNQPLSDRQRIRRKGFKTIGIALVIQAVALVPGYLGWWPVAMVVTGVGVIVMAAGVLRIVSSFFHGRDKAV